MSDEEALRAIRDLQLSLTYADKKWHVNVSSSDRLSGEQIRAYVGKHFLIDYDDPATAILEAKEFIESLKRPQ